MAQLTTIANLKGDQGDPGPQGLPGPEAVPAATAVAAYISDPDPDPGTNPVPGALNVAIAARLPSVNVADYGAVGDGTTDDLAAFNAAAAALGTAGGTIVIGPGHFILSDSWTIDSEWIKVEAAPDAIVECTNTASSAGDAVGFIGHNGAGTATTPQREYAEWDGGTIISPMAGANENALAAVRYKRVRVNNLNVPTAGRKAFTTQYGCTDVQVDGLTIGQTGNAAVSIEEQCDNIALNKITIAQAGRWGFYIVNSTRVRLTKVSVVSAGDRAYYFNGCTDVKIDGFDLTTGTAHGVEIQGGSGLYQFDHYNLAGIASGFAGFYVADGFTGELEVGKGTVDGSAATNIAATGAKRVSFDGLTARNVPVGTDMHHFNALTVRPVLRHCRGEGTAHAYTINAVGMNGHEPVVIACDLTAGASGKYGGWRAKADVIANGLGTITTLDWPSIAAGSTSEKTATVTGVVVTDSVIAAPISGTIEAGLVWSVYVSATNTITIRLANVTAAAIDPASQQWRVTVLAPA